MYAAGAGRTAADGEGRNSVFTTQLLKNLVTPDLEVQELFRRTGTDVSRASGRRQVPSVYTRFSGTAHLAPPPAERNKATDATRLWTVGASVGTSFAAPWIIGTVRGTLSPWRYSFFEIGFDAGFLSGDGDVGHLSLSPFAHFAFFVPFESGKGGLYAGVGGAYMYTKYTFPQGEIDGNFFMADVTTGFIILNSLIISYTLRTNFATVSNKLAVGYVFRFK
jgi:hypothetical protein